MTADAGVNVLVEDGIATIDFVDPAERGPGLEKLRLAGADGQIETLTRTGPRRLYKVPEHIAEAAGLITKSSRVDELDTPDTSSAGDASGMVQPDHLTSTEGFSPEMRTGSYSDAYSGGGVEFTDEQVVQIVEGVAEKLAESTGDTAAADSGADDTSDAGDGGSDPDDAGSTEAGDSDPTEQTEQTEQTDAGDSVGYDDGEPDMDWSRERLNKAAADMGVEKPEKLPNRQTVLNAYRVAKAAKAAAETAAQS